MEQAENSWKKGELVNFPWESNIFKKSGSTIYKHFYSSRFICIREEDEGHRGILLKVLGRTSPRDILMVGGEPFCKDERDDRLNGKTYSSFRFPTSEEVIEALGILRNDPELLQTFEKESMHLNINATYWVREATRSLLLVKKPQFYDASTNIITNVTDGTSHYRLTMLYFYKGEIIF